MNRDQKIFGAAMLTAVIVLLGILSMTGCASSKKLEKSEQDYWYNVGRTTAQNEMSAAIKDANSYIENVRAINADCQRRLNECLRVDGAEK